MPFMTRVMRVGPNYALACKNPRCLAASYLVGPRNMSGISCLVDGRVCQHCRNVLVLTVEVSCHDPLLRKPDLTREMKHSIWMLHFA